ncbi:NAD-dependent epimerase/dehydratase family protein [Tundrisphaera lichenicola]|uniref:NAD-dependent epimerase/dehydratase family protein n=1 Tax=Tundrisphaera lichenicola TaxID=2029860 RepID=UPI003EB85AED
MPVWMVTGGSGFLGRNFLDRGKPEGVEVIAIGRSHPSGVAFLPADLDDPRSVDRAVAEIAPDVVFHLAGRTPPGSPEDFYRSNTMGTVHLLDALRDSVRACRVVLAGSAAELGPVPVEDLPVAEDYPCKPADAYGLSKWLATSAGLAARGSLEVIVARIFNPIGPRLPESQALGRFAGMLGLGTGPIQLTVGDLGARRDFVDVRDVAGALMALADRGRPGQVYHVGTGRSQRVGDGLDRLIALSGREVLVEVDPALARRRGPGDSRADVRRIAEDTGWSAAIPWEQSLYDLWHEAAGMSGRA